MTRLFLVPAVAALAAAAGCGGSGTTTTALTTVASTARALATPAAAPKLGQVRLEDGPFTDRVRVSGLRVEATDTGPLVTGVIHAVADPSDLLVLEVLATFYGSDGRPIATGRQVFRHEHADEGRIPDPNHGNLVRLRLAASRPVSGPVSAVISIPTLVNE